MSDDETPPLHETAHDAAEPVPAEPVYDQAFFLELARPREDTDEARAEARDRWNAWRRDPANADVAVTFEGVDFRTEENQGISFVEFEFGNMARFDGATLGCGPNPFFSHRAYYAGLRRSDGQLFFAKRCRDRGSLLGTMFGTVPQSSLGSYKGRKSFAGAIFGYRASFVGATFGNRTVFVGAVFGERARFDGAVFGRGSSFAGTKFDSFASFGGAIFGDDVTFEGATIGNYSSFGHAIFGRRAIFGCVTFNGRAWFDGATFGTWAIFDDARGDEHAEARREGRERSEEA